MKQKKTVDGSCEPETEQNGAELCPLYPSKKILELLGNGHVTEKPEILFARLDLEEVLKKVEELHPPVEEEKEEEDVIDIEARGSHLDLEKSSFR